MMDLGPLLFLKSVTESCFKAFEIFIIIIKKKLFHELNVKGLYLCFSASQWQPWVSLTRTKNRDIDSLGHCSVLAQRIIRGHLRGLGMLVWQERAN